MRGDRLDQPGMRVEGNQADSAQTMGDEVSEDATPGWTRLGGATRTLRCPSLLTPVETRMTALVTRSPSRIFIVGAFDATNANEPATSRSWLRNCMPCPSRSAAILLTCDVERAHAGIEVAVATAVALDSSVGTGLALFGADDRVGVSGEE